MRRGVRRADITQQSVASIYRNIRSEFSFIYNMILSSRSRTRWLHLDFKVFLWLLSFRIHCCIQPGSHAANQDSTAAAWFTAWGGRKFSCSLVFLASSITKHCSAALLGTQCFRFTVEPSCTSLLLNMTISPCERSLGDNKSPWVCL